MNRRKKKIGLALGSGAARGLAHIGVLKALKEAKVPIKMIAGSSMGALVGACFAREARIKELEAIALNTDWKRLLRLADPNLALMMKGFIHGSKVKDLLRSIIGDVHFKDLKIPLAVVATDINTGREVVIKKGSVIEAVRASISIPAIFTPVKIRGKFLVDGGIVDPVPVKVVKDMGAAFTVACNVIHRPRERVVNKTKKKSPLPFPLHLPELKEPPLPSGSMPALEALHRKINQLINDNRDILENIYKMMDTFRLKVYQKKQKIDPGMPGIFDTIIRAFYAMEYEIARQKITGADVVITPRVGHIAALEFFRGREAVYQGYKAARRMIPYIRKCLVAG